MQKFKNIFKSSKPKPSQPPPLSKDQQLQQALFTLLAWRDFSEQMLSQQLTSLTDQLLWADKHSPQVMLKVIEAQLFDFTLLHIFGSYQIPVLHMCTLLLANLRNPQTVNYLLGCKLSELILTSKPEDQQAESYLMGWLKAYGQRVNKENVGGVVVREGRCLLLERCAGYCKSGDSMTRTTSLNIIINLIKGGFDQLKPCLASDSFTIFYVHMCEYFNNMLLEVDQFLLGLTQSKINAFSKMLDDLDDMLLFFDDLSAVQQTNLTFTLGTVVYQYIVLPALLASMRLKEKGMISINLATFVVIRMMRLLENLGIINLVVKLMFSENATAEFWVDPKGITDQQKMETLTKLLKGQKVYHQNVQKIAGIRESLFMFFRSKDDNLIYLMSTLLLNILRCKILPKQLRLQCGLNMRGEDLITRKTRTQLLTVLTNQLSSHFRIITMKNISALLVQLSMVNNDFDISPQSRTNLLDVYQHYIGHSRQALKDSSQYDKIAEYFQTDCKYISQKLLDTPSSIGKEAFSIPGFPDQRLGFYQRSPCNYEENVRQSLLMFILTRKMRYILIKESRLPGEEHNLQKLYNTKLSSDATAFRPGQEYVISNKKFYPCNIVGDRVQIPCYIVQDQLNFVIAMQDQSRLKIIVNLKFKHITPIVDHRDINNITIKIRSYNQTKQQFENKDDLVIRCTDNYIGQKIISSLIAKKNLSRQAELSFVNKLIQNSEKDLPEVNLIDL